MRRADLGKPHRDKPNGERRSTLERDKLRVTNCTSQPNPKKMRADGSTAKAEEKDLVMMAQRTNRKIRGLSTKNILKAFKM